MTRIVVLGTLACSGTEGTDSEDTDAAAPACETTISMVSPEDGSTGVYYRGLVEVELSKADDDLAVRLLDSDGDEVASEIVSQTESSVVLRPALSSDSDYTVAVTYCRGEATTSFSTSELGRQVYFGDIDGRTYKVDFGTATVVYPQGVGDILVGLLDGIELLLEASLDAVNLDLLGAVGVNDGGVIRQDFCIRTLEFPVQIGWENPDLVIDAEDFVFAYDDSEIVIKNLAARGTFAPDGSYLAGVALSGSVDTRGLAVLLPAELGLQGDDAVCTFVGDLGLDCELCGGDATQPYCLSLDVIDMVAEALDTLDIVEVTIDEIDINPTCDAEE